MANCGKDTNGSQLIFRNLPMANCGKDTNGSV